MNLVHFCRIKPPRSFLLGVNFSNLLHGAYCKNLGRKAYLSLVFFNSRLDER